MIANRSLSVLTLLSMVWGFGIAQNLVMDSTFSVFKKNAKYSGRITELEYWFCPNGGTPDVFNSRTVGYYSQPKNAFGFQRPRNGLTYAGLGLYNNRFSFQEYLSTKLSKKLVRDSLYCFTAYISLADTCKFATDGMDISMSKYKLHGSGYHLIEGQFTIYQAMVIKDTADWSIICNNYRANGGEEYLTIGNFKGDEKLKIVNLKKKQADINPDFNDSYYYITDVSFHQIKDSSECDCKQLRPEIHQGVKIDSIEVKKITEGTIYIFKNIKFETAKYELLLGFNGELDSLAHILNENINWKVEITGHTDSVGDNKMNQILSESRAKSVAEYLISKGIKKERISSAGYGDTEPIDTNETPDGRANNRRVEFTILRD